MKQDLDRCLVKALQTFKDRNKGSYPSKIIIYRDGVGEQMRDQIIAKEITQFKEAVRPLYN